MALQVTVKLQLESIYLALSPALVMQLLLTHPSSPERTMSYALSDPQRFQRTLEYIP